MGYKFIKLVIIFILLTAGAANAQTYRLLTANDFLAAPKFNNAGVVAYTNCSITYNYRVKRVNGIFRLDFNVSMQMNKHLSWLDKKRVQTAQMLAEVLKHEQGHYAIAYLQQQELLRTFGRTRFGRDYSIAVKNIFDRIDDKYRRLNEQYERETNHMQNRTQQASWDRYLARCLEYMPPLTAGN